MKIKEILAILLTGVDIHVVTYNEKLKYSIETEEHFWMVGN